MAAAPQRSAWVDLSRITAVVAVIAIHTVSSLVTNRSLPESWWFGNVVDSAARWSVPLFVMVSGALLLHSASTDRPGDFYRRRASRILIPLFAWTVIYLVVGHAWSNNPRTLNEAIALVLAGRPYFHLYFLYLIAGLYLIAPFLRPLVALPDRRILGIAAVVFLALGMADDVILVWKGIGGVNAVTRFLPYVGYFLAGAWLVELPPSRPRIAAAALVFGVGVIATAVGTELLVERLGLGKGRYLYEYLSATTVPTSLAIFALFRWSAHSADRLAARLPRGWLATVAAATLGVYLVHPLVLHWIGTIGLGARAFFVPLAVPATVISAFAVTLLIVLVMRQVPLIRRLV